MCAAWQSFALSWIQLEKEAAIQLHPIQGGGRCLAPQRRIAAEKSHTGTLRFRKIARV